MTSASVLRVFVGWDSREQDAYDVAVHSLRRHASVPLTITSLKQEDLRAQDLFWRERDPLAATEFTYTRFLTPYLSRYAGKALFFDCDFLWTADVAELLALVDAGRAVSCVHPQHKPREETKMDGAIQTQYPRKNWSSLMVFNCAHPSTRELTLDAVNTQSGAYLHRMQWAADEEIGALAPTWNWLEGWCEPEPGTIPKAIHFTRGGPWFAQWRNVAFADLWLEEFERVKRATAHVEA